MSIKKGTMVKYNQMKKQVDNTNKLASRGEYDNTPFSIINQSEILTKKDLDRLTPLTQELKETFIKSQVFRTRTEMEVSVLNDLKFPTANAKYWQAVREQNVQFQELVMLSYEYRKNLVEIKILQRDMVKEEDLEKELSQIEIEKKMFILKNQEKTAKDRIRELEEWSNIKKREAKQMHAKALENVDNEQLFGYTRRFINQKLKAGNNGSPAENNNLQGQLDSSLKACKKNGLLEEVLSVYPKEVQDRFRV